MENPIVITKLLGKGMQGRVYEGYFHGDESKKYAIKSLRNISGDFQTSISNEIANLQKLSSPQPTGPGCYPYIVCYYGFINDSKAHTFNILMELVKGKNLDNIIKNLKKTQSSLDADTVRYIILHLLIGLVYMHNHNIVHRDIKPDNIQFSHETKTIKYIDFGLSCSPPSQKCLNSGAPIYLPPEIGKISFEDLEAWKKVDVWSLGVTLYYLTNLNLPYENMSLAQIARGSHKQLYSNSGDSKVDQLINVMIEINPNNRPTAYEIYEFASELFSDTPGCTINSSDYTRDELVDILEQLGVGNISSMSLEEMCGRVMEELRMGRISTVFNSDAEEVSWSEVF